MYADIHTTETLALQPSAFKEEFATEKLRRHKLLGIRANYSKPISRKTQNIIFQDP
jgi:hypothetical protein